jgi:hypothetical protein
MKTAYASASERPLSRSIATTKLML